MFKFDKLRIYIYVFHNENENVPFFCQNCKPVDSNSNLVETDSSTSNVSMHDGFNNSDSSFLDCSSAHSSDFELIDTDSETDLRGLNFDSLPTPVTQNVPTSQPNHILPVNNRSFKYPCLVCDLPCKNNVQDSISCTLCDGWVHQKCSDLTLAQFKVYCSPEHANDPYWCEFCRFGCCSSTSLKNQKCLTASEINNLDANVVYDKCSNSVFKDQDDINISEYYTIEEANVEMKKGPDGILLIHINAVSLCANIEKIKNTLAKLEPNPSIIFVSETRIHDSKLQKQLNEIKIPGFSKPVYDNSKTSAGGTAIYVNERLKFKKRLDIKFDREECEACFIEVICKTSKQNPIFGALYRHPVKDVRAFTSYLGEFLECFSAKGTTLTLMGYV